VAIIGQLAGRPVTPRFGQPRPGELLRSALAIGRVGRDLGWRARTQLAAGIGAVYHWIEAGAHDRVGY
jgi:UDP-glucose 4-epimerase